MGNPIWNPGKIITIITEIEAMEIKAVTTKAVTTEEETKADTETKEVTVIKAETGDSNNTKCDRDGHWRQIASRYPGRCDIMDFRKGKSLFFLLKVSLSMFYVV